MLKSCTSLIPSLKGSIVARKMTRDLLLGIPDNDHRVTLTGSDFWTKYSTHQVKLVCKCRMLEPLLALEIGQAALIEFGEDGKPVGYQILEKEGNNYGEYRKLD